MFKRFFSSLYFVFLCIVFTILLITMTISSIINYFFISKFGAFSGIIILLIVSGIIGIAVTMIISKIILKPINEMLAAMKKLASGDFSIRLDNTGKFRPNELKNFSDGFNATAKELGNIEIFRSDFVNNFSHEFKTPIVSIKGFAKILKSKNITVEEREEYLDIIIDESNRLATLATNVLNLTKIENQTIITDMKPFNITEQLRRIILMIESKWKEKDLELNMNLDEIKYYGNADLLSEVWLNILDNAVKFSHTNGNLDIKLSEFDDYITFEVRDFGCGMDEDTKSHVFDKFFQGDSSHATEGNGLGMVVVQKIVSLHGGRISVESQPNQGTTVIVILPKQG